MITETYTVADKLSLWSRVERQVREPEISMTWTTLIAHDIEYINRRLSKSAYFFADIKTEARYEPSYRIEKEDLDYLSGRVRKLQEAVKLLCEQRIAGYEKEARKWGKGRK